MFCADGVVDPHQVFPPVERVRWLKSSDTPRLGRNVRDAASRLPHSVVDCANRFAISSDTCGAQHVIRDGAAGRSVRRRLEHDRRRQRK